MFVSPSFSSFYSTAAALSCAPQILHLSRVADGENGKRVSQCVHWSHERVNSLLSSNAFRKCVVCLMRLHLPRRRLLLCTQALEIGAGGGMISYVTNGIFTPPRSTRRALSHLLSLAPLYDSSVHASMPVSDPVKLFANVATLLLLLLCLPWRRQL